MKNFGKSNDLKANTSRIVFSISWTIYLKNRFDLENMGMVKSDLFLKRLGHQRSENTKADSLTSSLEDLGFEDPSATSIPYAILPGKIFN